MDRAARRGRWAPRSICPRRGRAIRRGARSARIPAAVVFQEKWRLALTLLRRTRAAGDHADRRRRRCRIRRQQHRAADAASPAAAVCAGDLADADGVSGHADAARRSRRNRGRAIAAAGWPDHDAGRRPRAQRRACRRGRGDASRGATAPIRRGRPTSPRCASRRRPTGASDASPPRSGCSASAGSARPDGGDTILVSLPATAVAAAARAVGASALGHRAALPRSQNRTGPRSFRRPRRIRAGSITW